MEDNQVKFEETQYQKDKKGFYTTFRERISYYSHSVGGMLFNGVFGATLILPFFTDMGIEPAIGSSMLLITKIWDAINDPIGGAIIERSNFKGGKYLPWLRMGTIALPVLLIFFFFVQPGWNSILKIIYLLLFYVLIEGVFTFTDAPTFGLSLASTNVVQERTKIYSTAGFFAGIGALLGTVLFTIMVEMNHLPYYIFGIAASLLYIGFSIWLPYNGKERFIVKSEEPIKVKDMVRSVSRNKYLLIYYICLFITFGTSTIQGVIVYVSRHVLNNGSLTIGVTLATVLPALVIAFLIPMITKHLDKFKLFIIFNVGTIVTSILAFFIGYDNILIFFIMCAIRGTFFGGISLMAYTFTGDLVEYGHFVKNERAEGIAFSFQTFAAKGISALQTFLVGTLLSLFGFLPAQFDEAGVEIIFEQSQQAIQGIWYLFTLIPCIGGIIGIVLFIIKYDLRDRDVQVMSKANHGEITREEALAQLSKEYN
jgi:Na+/melibiose symporter-like transporter